MKYLASAFFALLLASGLAHANPTTVTNAGITWTKCTEEGSTCAFTGTKSILFGVFTTSPTVSAIFGPFTGNTACNVGTMGSDPAPGADKACYLATNPTDSLTASQASIVSGQSVTLTLTSSNTSSCSGPLSTLSGTATVNPTATTTYTETCQGAPSTPPAVSSVTVTVTACSGGGGGTMPACAPSGTTAGPSGTGIQADVQSADGTRVFANGATFNLLFTTHASAADTLNYSIKDALGNVVKSASFPVAAGNLITTVPCSNFTTGGYFSVSASLTNAGGSLPVVGTRPPGIATFGILPATGLPAVTYAFPDQHRFGMQGFNDQAAPLAALGISWTIDDREQSWGEPSGPNTYTVSNDLDPFYAAHPNIMRLIRLDGIPAWNGQGGTANDSYSLPVNTTEYQAYMAKIGTDSSNIRTATYPNQRFNYYQVTWEPSLQWVYPSADFVTLYQLTYNGLHSTDTHAKVMGVTNPFPFNNNQATGDWLTQYQSSGLCNFLDGVTTHGYFNAGRFPPEYQNQVAGTEANSLNNEMHSLRGIMQSCKANMVLWSTEMGVSYHSGIAYGSSAITANELWSQEVEAVRAHLIILGEGAQMTTFFFGPDYPGEIGYGSFFSLSNTAGQFADTNLSPKPEAMAFAALTRIIDGTNTLGKITNMPTTGYGYAFQQFNGGKVIQALWVHDNAHWPVSGAYSQTYSVNYTATVDAAGTSGNVTELDAFGNPTTLAYTNGQVVVALTESPIYLVSANATATQTHVTAPVGYTGQ